MYYECRCPPRMFGNPYQRCNPECAVDSDCPRNLACRSELCYNPCEGACGDNTHCLVVMHQPVCTCVAGYAGDPPRTACTAVQRTSEILMTLLNVFPLLSCMNISSATCKGKLLLHILIIVLNDLDLLHNNWKTSKISLVFSNYLLTSNLFNNLSSYYYYYYLLHKKYYLHATLALVIINSTWLCYSAW